MAFERLGGAVIDWEEIKNWFTKYWFLISFVFFVLLAFAVVWFVFSYLDLSPDGLRKEVDSKDKLIERDFTITREFVNWIIFIISLFVLICRLIIMRRQMEISQEQLKISQEQLKISQNIRYAEQFEKSVKNLANEDLGIFKVGLVSLNALSQEGKKEYREVWEQLCIFLRHHEPLKDEREKTYPKVNAIAQMLRERNREEYEDFRLDLSGAHLEEANLYKAHLEGAKLEGTNLERAHLVEAHLENAHLVGVKLQEAYLVGAHLERAHLIEVNLYRAILDGANLSEVILWKVILDEAILWNVNLERAHLCDMNLDVADLKGANLEGALLGGKMESGEVQDLTALKPEQLRGTYYNSDYPMPKLPAGISEEDKPKAISHDEWFEKYRGDL